MKLANSETVSDTEPDNFIPDELIIVKSKSKLVVTEGQHRRQTVHKWLDKVEAKTDKLKEPRDD